MPTPGQTSAFAGHAPAVQLAALHHERREVGGVFAELKTHLHQRRHVLRSKKPDPGPSCTAFKAR